MNENKYQNPLTDRYASKEMNWLWSPQKKFSTWRKLWLTLATAQKELGLPITEEQIKEMAAHIENIDFDRAAVMEKELRHDVMSHIHVFAESCPLAKPIIHLGATSCFVTDNTDLLLMKEGLLILKRKLALVMAELRDLALNYRHLPTLGFTHYQPAQLTTVGKRASLWLYDFYLDFKEIDAMILALPFRGVKGTTGTQASFLALFNGDRDKVKRLDALVTAKMGFAESVPICGQTYTRKIDYQVLSRLSGCAQSAYKMAGDIRLLMNLREMDEPFEKNQVGSSAMAYKRNPMRCERICSLARYVMAQTDNAAQTHAHQWLERTLDDSANRRIVIPESFLTTDIILSLVHNVISGITVWPLVIRKRIMEELPFMATENIIMAGVKAGGDRQELHEAIRQHSLVAAQKIKEEGAENNLLARLEGDHRFRSILPQLPDLIDPRKFIGRAPEQVEEFIDDYIDPTLNTCRDLWQSPGSTTVVNV